MVEQRVTELEAESLLVRIYCVVGDLAGQKPLHEAIVETARAAGVAGASVLPAKMGFGKHAFYSDRLSETMADRQPVVVEIVDQPNRLTDFLAALHELVEGRRLITVERAEVILYLPESTSDDKV
jgi:PII-like signaling protein